MLQLFLAAPLGVGISSLVSFLWISIGLNLRLYAVTETASIFIIMVVLAWKRRKPALQACHNWRSPRSSTRPGWWLALSAALLMFSAQFWGDSLQNPHGGWDAWWNWNVVARFIFRGGVRWQATFLRSPAHPDYPFLMAMTNATTWELVQRDTTRGPMVLAFVFTVCLIGLMFALIRALRGSSQACLVAIVMLTQPLVVQTGLAQLADVPEACYFLASVCMMLLYLRSPRELSLAFVAGLTAGLSAWTKNEGLAFAVSNLVVWAHISRREKNLPVLYYLLGAAAPLAIVGIFKAFLAPRNDLFGADQTLLASLTDPARYVVVLRDSGITFWKMTGGLAGLLVLALILYACLIGKTRQGTQGIRYLTLIACAQAFVYLLVYVVTPNDVSWQIATSLNRLYLHVFPLMLGALFLWLKSPDELSGLKGANGYGSQDSDGNSPSDGPGYRQSVDIPLLMTGGDGSWKGGHTISLDRIRPAQDPLHFIARALTWAGLGWASFVR